MKLFTAIATITLLTTGLFANAEKETIVKTQNLSTFGHVIDVNESNANVSEVSKGTHDVTGTRDVTVTLRGCSPTSANDLLIVQSGTETAVNYTLVAKNNPMKAHVNCVATLTSIIRLKSLVSPSKLGKLNL